MPKPNKDRYDDSMFSEEVDEDLVRELVAEGYSYEEALRMVGDYDADEFDPVANDEADVSDLFDDPNDPDNYDADDFVDPEDFE
jgi:hypothetical protein